VRRPDILKLTTSRPSLSCAVANLALNCSKLSGNPGQSMFYVPPPVASLDLRPAAPPDANGSTPLASKPIVPSKCNEPMGYTDQFPFTSVLKSAWYEAGMSSLQTISIFELELWRLVFAASVVKGDVLSPRCSREKKRLLFLSVFLLFIFFLTFYLSVLTWATLGTTYFGGLSH